MIPNVAMTRVDIACFSGVIVVLLPQALISNEDIYIYLTVF